MPKDLRRRSRSLRTSSASPSRSSQSAVSPSRSSQNGGSRRVRGRYKPRKTAWQKVNAITTFMFREYRWTVKDFIRYFVTAEADDYKRSIQTRKKILKEAVIEQAEVLHCFEETQDISIPGVVSLQRLQKEMQQLQDNKGYFSQFDVAHPPENMDLTQAVQELQTIAPNLWKIIYTLMEPVRKNYERDKEPFENRAVYICAMLCYSRANMSSNFLLKLLGLYLYGSGVKRRCLSVLSGYGVCPSYYTLAKDMQLLSDIAKERLFQASLFSTNADHTEGEAA